MYGENKWLDRLNQMISEHLNQSKLNSEQITTSLKKGHFQQSAEVIGLPLRQCISQQRLEQAKKYMEEGTYKTVEETSMAVGYTSISTFVSQFKKEFGKTPLTVIQEAGWQ